MKRNHLLYHGTLLSDFDMALVDGCLRMPPRQPDYRAARAHGEFIANLPLPIDEIRRAIADVWRADQPLTNWPGDETAALVEQRYGREDWNARL